MEALHGRVVVKIRVGKSWSCGWNLELDSWSEGWSWLGTGLGRSGAENDLPVQPAW